MIMITIKPTDNYRVEHAPWLYLTGSVRGHRRRPAVAVTSGKSQVAGDVITVQITRTEPARTTDRG